MPQRPQGREDLSDDEATKTLGILARPSLAVSMARRKRPIPSRTRKLSSSAAMVLLF